jgi:hypothetical protein
VKGLPTYLPSFKKCVHRWEKFLPDDRIPLLPGANPTIVIYNATGSLARFKNKNILFCFEKHSSLLQRWRCSCKFKNRRIGSWVNVMIFDILTKNLAKILAACIYARIRTTFCFF